MELSEHLSPNHVVVYLLHGVVPSHRHEVRNYMRKHIDLARFREFLDALDDAGGVCISMDDVAAGCDGKELPPRAYALTFDDGFANNQEVAAPELLQRGLHATFYVTHDFIDGGGVSWTDQMEEALESFSGTVDWWGRPCSLETPADKREFLDWVRSVVKTSPDMDPYAQAETLRGALGAGEFTPDASLDAKMSWAQVARLHEDGFIVGNHGKTHRMFEFLSPESLREELAACQSALGNAIGAVPRHASYPEGRPGCDATFVRQELRAAGISCCPTAIEGVNEMPGDPFALKRINVV